MFQRAFEVMTAILFPVLHDHAEGLERLVSQTSSRFNAPVVLASAVKSDLSRRIYNRIDECANEGLAHRFINVLKRSKQR